MCQHETIQISQDGEKVIYCGDCSREFGFLGHDELETFVVFTPEVGAIVAVPFKDHTEFAAHSNRAGISLTRGMSDSGLTGGLLHAVEEIAHPDDT